MENNKKAGHKPRWCPKSLDDLIDIVVNSTEYKTKLIFTNTKNHKSGPSYAKILELKARASARGDELAFTVKHLRTKFTKCVSCCKQAALTVKTATGINRSRKIMVMVNGLMPCLRWLRLEIPANLNWH